MCVKVGPQTSPTPAEYRSLNNGGGGCTVLIVHFHIRFIFEVMEFLKNGHGKSWKSHRIIILDLSGKPGIPQGVI